MDEQTRLIERVFVTQKELKEVPFPLLIKTTTGKEIIPLDSSNKADMILIEKITKSITSYLDISKRTKRRIRGDRINEVGKSIEVEFVQELQRNGLEVNSLGSSGYPDIEIIDHVGRFTYLESKSTSKSWESSFRSFYYNTGKKVKENARHLLIGWRIIEESDKYWIIKGCKLVDLFNLSLKLKAEFNASNNNIYKDSFYEVS
ncbi:MAG: hypothetical protein GF411_20400 [Candidatus Lokiarchaeota archaeon]|nr:hypothetical protein [Candidatus Lokiarchaeota archaeon]